MLSIGIEASCVHIIMSTNEANHSEFVGQNTKILSVNPCSKREHITGHTSVFNTDTIHYAICTVPVSH